MYRLMLYCLIFFCAAALVLSFLGFLPFKPLNFLFSVFLLVLISWATNKAFARIFNVPVNVESAYITAFILSLIITPLSSFNNFGYIWFLVMASVLATASKYILAINKKHIFNPAAFGVAITAFTISQSASWWVGILPMTPFVLIGGLLVARKIQRFDLVLTFLAVSLIAISFNFSKLADFIILKNVLVDSPILFFTFIMLTEPLSTPPTRTLRIYYGALAGLMFAPQIHFGPYYSTPELALLTANIFSYIVSPKFRLILKLKAKNQIAPDTYELTFTPDRPLKFKSGQYLEWTLGYNRPDSRGNRRYFTIASSPTEKDIKMGVKFYPNSSSFKKSLLEMRVDKIIVASQLAGDFVLPKNKNQKLFFIAGGIGITPFRSMIKYMLDSDEKRQVVLFYSNKTFSDIVYTDIFDEAREKFGLKTVYTLTDSESISMSWLGQKGLITEKMIRDEVPDYKERLFYISGPRSMVIHFEDVLKKIGVKKRQIKTDFFPGYV